MFRIGGNLLLGPHALPSGLYKGTCDNKIFFVSLEYLNFSDSSLRNVCASSFGRVVDSANSETVSRVIIEWLATLYMSFSLPNVSRYRSYASWTTGVKIV
jgi:hypothetical protein